MSMERRGHSGDVAALHGAMPLVGAANLMAVKRPVMPAGTHV